MYLENEENNAIKDFDIRIKKISGLMQESRDSINNTLELLSFLHEQIEMKCLWKIYH